MLGIGLTRENRDLGHCRRETYHRISGSHLLHQTGIVCGELLMDLFRFFIFRRVGKFDDQWRRAALRERDRRTRAPMQ